MLRRDGFQQQWLFYDILSAKTITGVYDGCLFSLRPPQAEFPDEDDRRLLRSRMVRRKLGRVNLAVLPAALLTDAWPNVPFPPGPRQGVRPAV